MQRIEFRLIFFPDLKEWRLYNGDEYRVIAPALNNLHTIIASMLNEEAKILNQKAEDIRFSNPNLATLNKE